MHIINKTFWASLFKGLHNLLKTISGFIDAEPWYSTGEFQSKQSVVINLIH